MLQIKNTLGGGKPEGLFAWTKHEIGSEPKVINKNVSTLPFAFYSGSAVVLNGEIHILGGSVQSRYHYKWDGSSWTSVSTLPYDFYSGSAVVLNGEIHILGGDWNGTRHYKWDGSSWTSVGTLPYDFYLGFAVVLNGEIHILGSGNNSNSYYTNHYKWNGTSWTSVSTLPYVFYNSSAVVFNNEIHILGGGNKSSYYTNHYKWNGTSWTSVSTLPYNFYDGSAVVFNNEIHILGGGDGTVGLNHYKWDGSSWVSVGTLPHSFDDGSAVIYNNAIHILGSYNSNYRTAHYLVYGYVTVYTFLDYIVSDKETAYPNGDVHTDGYYYEKVGRDLKYTTGTIIYTSNTNIDITRIEHGLGEKPKIFYVVASIDSVKPSTTYTYFLVDYFVNNYTIGYSGQSLNGRYSARYSDGGADTIYYGYTSANANDLLDDITAIIGYSYYALYGSSASNLSKVYFEANVEYRWYAITW